MRVILNNIRSLHNVGSVFRTADALGVEMLYLCGITPAPLDRFQEGRQALLKVSLGAEKNVRWSKVQNFSSLVKKLKLEGFRIFALEQSPRSLPYSRLHLSRKLWAKSALVLGNEVKGLDKRALVLADQVLEIPMYGTKESLNVGVAFGVVGFHLRPRGRKYY